MVNIALNNIRGTFDADYITTKWVVAAYTVANMFMILIGTWLELQVGRRLVFIWAFVLFTIGSFLCGNAASIQTLIIFRFLQGLGGGLLLISSFTAIMQSWPTKKRLIGVTINLVGVLVSGALFTPFGGYIVDHYDWPFVFFFSIPFGIIAILLGLIFFRRIPGEKKIATGQLDWWGLLLLIISVGSFQIVLETGAVYNWFHNTVIVLLSAVAIVGSYFFIRRQLSYIYPIVELKLFRNRSLRVGTVMLFIVVLVLSGSQYLIRYYLAPINHWITNQTLVIPLTVALFAPLLIFFLVTIFINRSRINIYLLAGCGLVFLIYGYFSCKALLAGTEGYYFFAGVSLPLALAADLLIIIVTTMALSRLEGAEVATGTALTTVIQLWGRVIIIALTITFFVPVKGDYNTDLIKHLDLNDPKVQQSIKAAEDTIFQLPADTAQWHSH